jgi:hypothetical protein
MDCFVAALLAMTENPELLRIRISNSAIHSHSFAISPHHSREVFLKFPPSSNRGHRESRVPEHPQSVCKKCTRWTTSTPENTRLSPRNGFNGFLRALPGDEFLLSPSLTN